MWDYHVKQTFRCKYALLDNSHKTLLGCCLIIFGSIGTILNVWLLCTFLKSRLLISRSYLFLLTYCLACLGRSLLAGFPFVVISAFNGKWIFGVTICHLSAFLRHLFSIFQMYSLLFSALERYQLSRKFLNAGELPFRFHLTGLSLSWIIATIFATLPLLGYGNYSCDLTGVGCDLEWVNYGKYGFTYNLLLILCCGLIPLVFCLLCLKRAIIIEGKTYSSEKFSNKLRTTRMIYVMTIIIFVVWIPSAILYLLLFVSSGRLIVNIPAFLPIVAQLSSEASTMIPVLVYLTYGGTIRLALINLCTQSL